MKQGDGKYWKGMGGSNEAGMDVTLSVEGMGAEILEDE